MNQSFNRKLTFSNVSTAKPKAVDSIITVDQSLKTNKDYIKIVDTISRLIESGLTKMGEGYCISVSDIIYNILTQNKIKCHLVECQLSIVDNKTNATHMIGFNTTFQQNSHTRVSTHVVVVTDTEIPMFIDASIAHKLPNNKQVIIEKAHDQGSKVFSNFSSDNFSFIYQEKKDGIGVPQLHQISILERIGTDRKIFNEINLLKKLNYVGIFLSAFAMINILIKFFIDF